MKHFTRSLKLLVFLSLVTAVQLAFAQQPTQAEIKTVANRITLGITSHENPVVMNAVLMKSEVAANSKAYVVVKIKIENNWHIYAYVPEGGYFITSELELTSDNAAISTELIEEPNVHGYPADPNIMVYKDELVFVYEIEAKSAGTFNLDAVLNYQACDPYSCLPPNELKKSLELTIK